MNTFEEFWPFYLSEHSNATNRRLHFAGTFLVHVLVVVLLITKQWNLAWALPILGYGFAWVGHFIVEKNRPATFKHPLWSLRGDMKMFYMMLGGKLWK